MLRVLWMSGALCAEVDTEEYQEYQHPSNPSSFKAFVLKCLEPLERSHGFAWYRLRVFAGGKVLEDETTWEEVGGPQLQEVRVLVLNFTTENSGRLLRAALRGEEAEGKQLVEDCQDPNCLDQNGRSPLLLAAQGGHLGLVQLLSRAGGGVNAADANGVTPAIAAARSGHLPVLQFLCQRRANLTAADSFGVVPLIAACENLGPQAKTPSVLQFLLQARCNPNRARLDRVTGLHLCAEQGAAADVQLLLLAAAGINAVEEAGASPLLLASSAGQVGVVELLLRHRADHRQCTLDGWTPFAQAASHGHIEVLQQLLLARADMDTMQQDGATPLYFSVQDVNRAAHDGTTPLLVASYLGQTGVLRELLAAAADPQLRDSQGTSAMLSAISQGHRPIVQLLQAFAGASGGGLSPEPAETSET